MPAPSSFGLGLSSSAGASISSPKTFNVGSGRNSPVVWIVVGAVALIALVLWFKRGK